MLENPGSWHGYSLCLVEFYFAAHGCSFLAVFLWWEGQRNSSVTLLKDSSHSWEPCSPRQVISQVFHFEYSHFIYLWVKDIFRHTSRGTQDSCWFVLRIFILLYTCKLGHYWFFLGVIAPEVNHGIMFISATTHLHSSGRSEI